MGERINFFCHVADNIERFLARFRVLLPAFDENHLKPRALVGVKFGGQNPLEKFEQVVYSFLSQRRISGDQNFVISAFLSGTRRSEGMFRVLE
jgi:hypothetical protein